MRLYRTASPSRPMQSTLSPPQGQPHQPHCQHARPKHTHTHARTNTHSIFISECAVCPQACRDTHPPHHHVSRARRPPCLAHTSTSLMARGGGRSSWARYPNMRAQRMTMSTHEMYERDLFHLTLPQRCRRDECDGCGCAPVHTVRFCPAIAASAVCLGFFAAGSMLVVNG